MDYLIKPFEPDDLLPKISGVYENFQKSTHLKRDVGAIVLATGTTCFDPASGKNPMGYGEVPNVVTGLELERMLSGSGPDHGRLLRPSDKRPVKKAAWIQCVGSRDLQFDADYCSTICCMVALKEVELARKLGRRIGEELGIPVYFYEEAATRPERRNLADVRRGEYEQLQETIASDPERAPDVGPAVMGSAGATATSTAATTARVLRKRLLMKGSS